MTPNNNNTKYRHYRGPEHDIIDLPCMSGDVLNFCFLKFWPQIIFAFRLSSLFMVPESLIYKIYLKKVGNKIIAVTLMSRNDD